MAAVPGGLELEDALSRIFEALGVQAVAKEGEGAAVWEGGREAGGKKEVRSQWGGREVVGDEVM